MMLNSNIITSLVSRPGSECRQRPDVENANTAYIDASFLYGSDEGRALSLRTMAGGQLKVTVDNRQRVFPFITNDKIVRWAAFRQIFTCPK
jgi:hypothetical protein